MTGLESGDYISLDDTTDYSIFRSIERLQSYAQTLRSKLETEKVWLANLKSETQLMLAQKVSPFAETGHLPQCPMAGRLVPPSGSTSEASLADPCGNHVDNCYSVPMTDDMRRVRAERSAYVQRLNELDYMCKREMSMINQVAYELEPLNQMSSDWNLQAHMSKPVAEKDLVTRVLEGKPRPTNASSRNGERLFAQDKGDRDTETKSQVTKISAQPEESVVTVELGQFIPVELAATEDFPKIVSHCRLPVELSAAVTRQSSSNVISDGNLSKPSPKLTEPAEGENTHPRRSESAEKYKPSKKSSNKTKSTNSPAETDKEKDSVRIEGEMDPIIWGRLAVDKKKKKLNKTVAVRPSNKSLKRQTDDLPSDDSDFFSDESGADHFTTTAERVFLKKYMNSDSDYVYSPLFVSESEDE